jgi:excisionase family DNA binding protein
MSLGMSEEEKMYTPLQAAERMHLNEQTVRRFLREKKLRGSLIGRVWIVRESDIEHFLDAQANIPAPKKRKN